MFSIKIPNTLQRKQKNRLARNILFYKINFKFFSVISLTSYKLFISRLKRLNVFFSKAPKRFRRISRKDRFRKGFSEDTVIRRYINKQTIKIFGISKFLGLEKKKNKKAKKIMRALQRRRNLRFKRKARSKKSFICLNLKKIPFTKKPNCSRMGKGKGAIKAWFMHVFPGQTVIILKNWRAEKGFYVANLLKFFLPGKNYVCSPQFLIKNKRLTTFNAFY